MKKKLLRPFIAVLLTTALLFSFAIPASAEGKRIARIELYGADAITFYEHCDGEWKQIYNPKTKLTDSYFHYNTWNFECQYLVTYTDGTDEVFRSDELNQNNDIYYSDGQEVSHWTRENEDNFLVIHYKGGMSYLPVEIIENPVNTIELVQREWVIDHEEYTPIAGITLIEHKGGQERTETNEETGETYTYFHYDNFPDIYLKITYVNGDIYYADNYEIPSGLQETVRFGENQIQNPWILGQQNVMYVDFMDRRATADVTLLENPVASIEPVPGTALHLYENAGGYYTSSYDPQTDTDISYFRYNVMGDGIRVIIHYKDPAAEDVTAQLFSWVDDVEVRYQDEQWNTPWSPEKDDNVLIVEYMGQTTEIPVVFDENPVDSIAFLDTEGNPIQSLTLVENCGGYDYIDYDEQGNQIKRYVYYVDGSKVRILIRYNDGTERIADPHSLVDGYDVAVGTNQYDHFWEKDQENILIAEYLGKSAEIPVTLVDNPVDHIELLSPLDVTFVENANGHIDHYLNDRWENVEYYRYDIPSRAVQIKIWYTDENREPVIANLHDFVDGYEVRTEDNQPWAPEADNQLSVEYMGHSMPLSVVFAENPVDHIEVIRDNNSPYMVLEHYDGNYERRDLPEGGQDEYYRYNINPDDISVRIVYKDTTEVTARIFDDVDGFRVEAGHNQAESPWVYRGKNILLVEYLGCTDSLPVIVISGDVNDDGSTDIVDLICLTNRIRDGIYEDRADVDQDGDVDEDDKELLTQILNLAEPGQNIPGPIEIESDITGDGETNVLDMIRLKKIISSGDYDKAADLNNDGRMDAEDLMLLFQSLM